MFRVYSAHSKVRFYSKNPNIQYITKEEYAQFQNKRYSKETYRLVLESAIDAAKNDNVSKLKALMDQKYAVIKLRWLYTDFKSGDPDDTISCYSDELCISDVQTSYHY